MSTALGLSVCLNKTDVAPIFMEHLPGKDSGAHGGWFALSASGLQTEKILTVLL